MCIAIYKPSEKVISRSTLENCFNSNPDGAGVAYRKNIEDKITIEKGFFDFKDFYSFYKQLDKSLEMLIHFRIGTSGKLNKNNCHPFLVNNKDALIHNGVLKHFPFTKKRSDTNYLCNILLNGINLNHSGLQNILEIAIGTNKIAIMPFGKPVVILNESLGEYKDDIWFSNDSYKCTWNYSIGLNNFPYSVYKSNKADSEVYESYDDEKLQYYLQSELDLIYSRYPEMKNLCLYDMEDSLYEKDDYDISSGKLI